MKKKRDDTVRICPNCGTQITDDLLPQCPNCGCVFKTPTEINKTEPEKNNNKNTLKIILIILGVFLLITAILVTFKIISNKEEKVIPEKENETKIMDIIQFFKDYQEPNSNDAFYMPIENVTLTAKGLSISGEVVSGMVYTGDELEITGMDKETTKVKVKEVEVNNIPSQYASAKDKANIILDGVYSETDFVKGQLIASTATATPTKNIEAVGYLGKENDTTIENITFNNNNNLVNGETYTFVYRNVELKGKITMKKDSIKPGTKNFNFTVEFEKTVPSILADTLIILDGDKQLGIGVVTKIN